MIAGYGYDVFGAIRAQTGSSPNYWLFTGEQRDSDSSFYYLRARYYDPTIGRFVGRDPIPGSVLDPLSLSPYLYARDNPINYIDPSGLVFHKKIKKAVQKVSQGIVTVGVNIFEKLIFFGECGKLAVVSAGLFVFGVALAISPAAVAATGVGTPVAIAWAIPAEIGAAASFGAAAGVGYSAYKLCTDVEHPFASTASPHISAQAPPKE